MPTRIPSCLALSLLLGCATAPVNTSAPQPQPPWRETAASLNALLRSDASEWPAEEASLAAALDLSAADAPDSVIDGLLARRLAWPAQIAVAVLHLRGPQAIRSWISGTTSDLSQALADSAVQAVARAPRVARASVLPALLVGERPSVAGLREAAARVQAEALLVYRPSCRVYERTPFVGSIQYRAQCTLQVVLLDTRSGLMPFAMVVTRERVTTKQRGDFDRGETVRRAQAEAVVLALGEVGTRLAQALGHVPVAGS
ncbi:MAG TPA: hypothetical protein VGQ06_02430 [Gemmatimonadales bacterium]|jgi:hypothetical protein|nr:hypothetical protein [Gemmatimonadales bacterium]